MCSFAYVVAKKSGYNEDFSKGLGIAVGTYYAIMKNVGLGHYGKARRDHRPSLDYQLIDSGEIKKVKYLNFCGGVFAIRDNKVLGIAMLRGYQNQNAYLPEKFDWQAQKINSIRPDGFVKVCQKWEEILKDYDLEQVRNGRLYFQIWRQHRDKLRKPEFYK